jgi:putative transposase
MRKSPSLEAGLPASTITRLKEAWTKEYDKWTQRSLEGKEYVYVWADGIRETEQSWKELLLDLRSRGLVKSPKLAICDGAPGFQNAVDQVWGEMKIQRCWFHKMGNVLDKLPDCVQTKAKKMLQNMFLADTGENALKAYGLFIEAFEHKYPKAAECLSKDKENLFRFSYNMAESLLCKLCKQTQFAANTGYISGRRIR